nr:hypothetical protein L203_01689 [Cryptococcus depauperatus CBS 7841]
MAEESLTYKNLDTFVYPDTVYHSAISVLDGCVEGYDGVFLDLTYGAGHRCAESDSFANDSVEHFQRRPVVHDRTDFLAEAFLDLEVLGKAVQYPSYPCGSVSLPANI